MARLNLSETQLEQIANKLGVKFVKLGEKYPMGDSFLIVESGTLPRWAKIYPKDDYHREEDEINKEMALALGFPKNKGDI